MHWGYGTTTWQRMWRGGEACLRPDSGSAYGALAACACDQTKEEQILEARLATIVDDVKYKVDLIKEAKSNV